jgi:hypothetical protein
MYVITMDLLGAVGLSLLVPIVVVVVVVVIGVGLCQPIGLC